MERLGKAWSLSRLIGSSPESESKSTLDEIEKHALDLSEYTDKEELTKHMCYAGLRTSDYWGEYKDLDIPDFNPCI